MNYISIPVDGCLVDRTIASASTNKFQNSYSALGYFSNCKSFYQYKGFMYTCKFALKYILVIYSLPHNLAQTIGAASMAALFEQHWMVEHLAAHGAFIGLVQRLQEVILGVLMITGKRYKPNKECDCTILNIQITYKLGMGVIKYLDF